MEMSTTITIFIYAHSKFVIIENADFECWHIMTHTKEKPSYITFTILPFYQKQINKQTNKHPKQTYQQTNKPNQTQKTLSRFVWKL